MTRCAFFCFSCASSASSPSSNASLLRGTIITLLGRVTLVTGRAVPMMVMLLLLALLAMVVLGAAAPSLVVFYAMREGTLVLAAVACVMSCLTANVAGLISGWLSIVPSLAPSGIVLQFNFHLLSAQTCVVEPASIIGYSFTATLASSPSLYSINANEYSLLQLFLTTTESSLPQRENFYSSSCSNFEAGT